MDQAWARHGRRQIGVLGVLVPLVVVVLAALSAGRAEAGGITNAGSDLRDGWYGNQPRLAPDAVSASSFGNLWYKKLDGQIYAQPLVLGASVIVATEHNKVYSLDAETGAIQWTKDLGAWFPAAKIGWGCGDLWPDLGVTSTPVIDPATNTVYLTHKTYAKDANGVVSTTEAAYWMDALDATTGAQRSGFPQLLSGIAQNAPSQSFYATNELQRPGLLLLDGVVYAGFGGHCDIPPYQGWVFGVNAASGTVKARWAALTTGDGAGIWQSGAGLMSDGPGRLFVSTGNGGSPTGPSDTPSGYFGESIVRLAVQGDGTLKPMDFFAPADAAILDEYDADFASGGVTALRDDVFGTSKYPHVGVAVGKAGYVYLLNRDDLGGIQNGAGRGDDVIARVGPYGGVWSRPGVWPGDGGWIAIPTASPGGGETPDPSGSSGFLKVYRYRVSSGGVPSLEAPVQSDDPFGFSSGAPVITSNGTTSGSALLWIIWSPNGGGGDSQLRVYDPVPQGGKLVLRRSFPIGTSTKFSTPGVGAGRVYVGNRSGEVFAFGAPVTAEIQAPATTFPVTTLGQSTTVNVRLTAGGTVKVTGVSTSGVFTAASGGLGLPKTLTDGLTLDVPVTFTPTATGSVGGSLTVTTDKGTFTFSLSGTGQAAAAMLTATPPVVSFGGATVGDDRAGPVTFSNTGGQPLTVQAVHLPAAPFSVVGAPEVGDVLDPGEAINVTVNYRPTEVGDFNQNLVLDTTAGSKTVGLSGSAGLGPVLAISPESGWSFGDVVVGESKTESVVISNTGDSTLHINKSKAPTGAAFTVISGLDEGSAIPAGESRTVTVKFTPSAAGTVSDAWTLNTDDGTGVHAVPVTGRGLVPGQVTGPASAAVGDVVLGSSGTAAVTFRNSGDVPVTVSGFDAPAAPFSVSDAPLSGTAIAPGGSLTVHVAFAAGTPGTVSASLTLRTSGGNRTVALSGVGVTAGVLEASGWAFGDVALGASKVVEATLRNTGAEPLTVLASTPPVDPRFEVLDGVQAGDTLAPGATRALRVRFTPVAAGDASASWALATTAEAGTRMLPLTARGVASGNPAPPSRPFVLPAAPAPVVKARPGLTLSKPKLARDRRTLSIRGRIARAATGTVQVTVRATTGRKTITKHALIRLRARSTYAGTLKLATSAMPWTRLETRVAFAGDDHVWPGVSAYVLVRRSAR